MKQATPTGNIAFIGGGNMTTAIVGGLVTQGFQPDSICVAEPGESKRQALEKDWGVSTRADNQTAAANADILVLAVKPQMLAEVCTNLAPAVAQQRPLVISIAAGVPLASLNAWLGDGTALVRAMPNTPALVGSGATGLYAEATLGAADRERAGRILQAVGLVLWVDTEAQLDAVTAVSGSGPAYFFLMVEAMAAAGEKLGLGGEQSLQLSLATALGAARMASASDVSPAELRRRVTSPGGTTERAIERLQGGGFDGLVEAAMFDCAARAQEMAAELSET